jgi:hypothetical protein
MYRHAHTLPARLGGATVACTLPGAAASAALLGIYGVLAVGELRAPTLKNHPKKFKEINK